MEKNWPRMFGRPDTSWGLRAIHSEYLRLETGRRASKMMSTPEPLGQQMGGRRQLHIHFDLQFLPGGSWAERTSHWLGWGFSTRSLGSVRLKVSHRRRPSPLGAIFLRAGENPNRKTARPFLKVETNSKTLDNSNLEHPSKCLGLPTPWWCLTIPLDPPTCSIQNHRKPRGFFNSTANLLTIPTAKTTNKGPRGSKYLLRMYVDPF